MNDFLTQAIAMKALKNGGSGGAAGGNAEQIAKNKADIILLKEGITDLKSVMKDIHNNTPHASTIKDFYNIRRTGKVYQTKIWKFATNPTSSGEKLLDNAGLEFVPSTDTTEGKDDYLNGNHLLFDWVHCNYKRNDDGTAYPIATEYDDTYQETGSVDVGAMQMSFWWNWDASNPEYDLVTISDTPNEKYKLKPWTECKRADRTITPWCIGSAYVSGIASDGLLRSQPGLKPERNQSHNNMITNYQKKGKGYLGAGSERNTFQILFNIIKGATKNSQSLFQGCTGYSFQYSASVESADTHTYFPVTNAQAQNILVGSYVSVGYGELKTDTNTVNNDRGVANIHKYADDVKVLKIETLDANNKAVYLDIETGFNTMPIKLSDTVNAPITITSMHWWSGSTDAVIGRHDGCNLFLSQICHEIAENMYRIRKKRNGTIERANLVKHQLFFMDDILILGTNAKDIHKAMKLIIQKADEMGLKIKDSWTVYTTVTKRKDDGHFIDIMGVRIYRQHITIRRRVFLRVRRSYKKAQSLVKQRKKIPVWLARKCMSYKGILDHTDSYNIKRRYNANKTIQICKGVISHESKIRHYTRECYCKAD